MFGKVRRSALVALVSAVMLAPTPSAWSAPSPSPVATPDATQTPTPAPSSSPTASPSATPRPYPTPGAPCSAASVSRASALGKFYAHVVDAETGRVLLDIRGAEQTPSASVLKVVTAASAMVYLPPSYTAKTSVYLVPSQPGTLVLVGGGDHTLSAMTGTSFTTYTKAPRLDSLAARVLQLWPHDFEVKKIILVDNFFSGPSYNSAWKASDRTNGYVSHITSLQVDSDRANPDLSSTAYSGFRSKDPVLRAGLAFKSSLQDLATGAQVVKGKLPAGAKLIAQVSSQPMSVWLDHALTYSDNTETEFIGRHAAKAAGLDASFKSIQRAATSALAKLGVDSTGLVMRDASGLAQANRVTPKLVTELLAKIYAGEADLAPGQPSIAAMRDYLPRAGLEGTLAGRFNGTNAQARSFVRAKSGYIPGLYSLAGIVDSRDGGRIAFSAFARSADGKTVGYAARAALDAFASRIYQCGVSLTK